MSENICPKCQSELGWDGKHHCESCQAHFTKVGFALSAAAN